MVSACLEARWTDRRIDAARGMRSLRQNGVTILSVQGRLMGVIGDTGICC